MNLPVGKIALTCLLVIIQLIVFLALVWNDLTNIFSYIVMYGLFFFFILKLK